MNPTRNRKRVKVLSNNACFNTKDAQPLDFIAAAESVIREAPITKESRNLLQQRISSRLIPQVNGTPMGSSLSGLIAEAVL
ncbi:unnamed protein product [Schistocephalus solidus]|uniref:Uncharacterized protein n=1 Tax=Schistocephalus solidus TaxID=70667 RepID=A0A183SEX5_SCHSO|nr:unnamed protein product [Schistocephalus solidus]